MSEKPALAAIVSGGDINDLNNDAVDLQAVASHTFSLNEVAGDFTNDQKHYILSRLGYDDLTSFDDLPVTATYMLEKINALDVNEAVEILKQYLEDHYGDVNIPNSAYDLAERLVNSTSAQEVSSSSKIDETIEKTEYNVDSAVVQDSSSSLEFQKFEGIDWALQVKTEAGIINFWSPYPEVRSVTNPYDDPNTPCETLRAYIVGIIWTAVGSFINQYFYDRQPSITFDSSVAQLFIYPTGMAMQYILPAKSIKFGKFSVDLNPGPWNYKEQLLATLFFSVSSATIYVNSNITVQKLSFWYDTKWMNFGYQVLLALSTQFMGFGFAGIMRKFLVYPVNAIWPSIMPTLALNNALMQPEKKANINGWTISRYSFYFITCAASFLYFWIPDYLFQALSTFNWMTWIKPDNFNLAAITGSVSGMGLNPITTFDWNIINYNYPLTIPFFSQANQYIGSIIAFFCIIGVWYSNYKWTGYLPLNSNSLFSNTGDSYDISQVLNEKKNFDNEKYQTYGPPFYTAANLVVYGAFFAIYPFTIVYVAITNFAQLKHSARTFKRVFTNLKASTFEGFNDPFSRSMRKYKEVPEWWFAIILVISIVLAILCVKVYPADTPVWGIFFALAINFIFLIPLSLVYATTGFSFGLNVLVELIVGYAIPGNGLALNFIKALGYNIDGQAQNYVSDQKMAHYMRIPPRSLFRVQMTSVLLATFVNLGTLNLAFSTIKGYCTPDQPQKFSCPQSTTFFSASVLWGVIGPKKVFNGLYPILQWCFLIGFLLAFPCALVKIYWRNNKYVKFFQPVLIIGGFLIYAPYNLSYYTPALITSFFFMHVIRKRYFSWWSKYTYVLGGGLQAGVAFSAIIIFFAVQYHEKDVNWWGNTVSYAGLDYVGPARLNATISAPDGYFGPRYGDLP
ncbi:hypothetical protein CLUG_02748 [Clavispora lusitaniae ATCC 42720]|uniref:Oligopeptide transporter n=1 Tax=Clavispora lusitaniae (strain ATCC 42720) TaxID=306902 RepID=C4Y2I5_CLAL4|nr:uncharacterized protein CLUG_02748 [Clavispora lusitaniae ATCC 42720]EEQ38622.1 hypothetical protein CLUG_02748 [Clavispora lusitaniae ATCC 42720]